MQVNRLEDVFKSLGMAARGKTCEGMKGLIEEGQEMMEEIEQGPTLDAALISAAQKVEHYEIATYGTVRTYAQVVGERGVAKLLQQTLKEEHAADRKLTTLAVGSINRRAAAEWHEQTSAAGVIQKGAAWVGSTVGGALKRVMPRSEAADTRRSKSRKSSRRTTGTRGRKRATSSRR
jgi:hypothetical protein